MLSPRWMKLARDIALTPGRIAMMVLAIAAGVFGLATMLSSYTILSREITRNYLDTNPASATLRIDAIDAPLIRAIRDFPGIAATQASSTIGGRVATASGTWMPLTLFEVEDFAQMRINTIYPEAGAWPPPPGSILLERDTLKMIGAKIGDHLTIKTADGSSHELLVSGTTHDPGMPVPSLSVFAYVTPATVAGIGANATLRDLKITVKDHPFDIDAIERAASQLALWLVQQGRAVELIRIPPPGEHPHQLIMKSILAMLMLFSFVALVLSAVLTATILDGLLAQQVRQIGVMKTVGARSSQIATLYLTFVAIAGIVATCIGVPAGLAAGRAFSDVVLVSLLNFTLHSGAVPRFVYLVLIITGVLIPVGIASIPILNAARISVQSAITDSGASQKEYGAPRFGGWVSRCIGKLPGVDRSLLMALRNSFRRRGRLLLTLALLAMAGAMFISSLSVRKASEQHLIEAAADRHYDLEIALSRPEPIEDIKRIIGAVPGVRLVEAWSSTTVAKARPDGLEIERTYPDGAHGTLSVAAVPDASKMISLTMLGGRWLTGDDLDAVVLNRKATESFPHVKVGDNIALSTHGRAVQLRVVGIARQYMTGAVAYVSSGTFAKLAGQIDRSRSFRIVMDSHNPATIDAVTRQIEITLGKDDISTSLSVTESMLRKDADSHFDILIGALLFISILMTVVGVFGLGSAMSTNNGERMREFGIMRSIGATSGVVLRNVLVEGVFIGLMSWLIAVALAVPLSAGIGAFLGNLLFGTGFPLALSQKAIGIWLFIVVAGSIAASAYPAWKASRLTIRETLAYL